MNAVVSSSTLVRLGPPDAAALQSLLATVTSHSPSQWLRPRPQAAWEAALAGAGAWAFGAWTDDCLVAAAMLRSLPPEAAAGPRFPRVPTAAWPAEVRFLESAIVHPEHRGRGWQRRLVEARIALARQQGARWACSGVHVLNTVSWFNLLACGFAVVGVRHDLGDPVLGLLRDLHADPVG